MKEVLRSLRQWHGEGRDCVLCSVVETKGSTPQKPGAAMVVLEDGRQAGTLGGGCVESEVRQRAIALLAGSDEPMVLSFTLDDDYGWDDGLICGGKMVFLAEPVRAARPLGYFDSLADQIESGAGSTEAAVIDAAKAGLPLGARFLFGATGEPIATHRAERGSESVLEGLIELSRRPRPYVRGGVAYLPHLTRCRLVIVGAGHVGQKVAQLAHEVDFDVWVLDDREKYACRERFPNATLLVGDIGRTLKELRVDANTYCLIVTRGHSHDEEALYHLATKPAGYLGMIGSKRKIRMIFEDLRKEGISTSSLDRVHAPLGLDIGSQTVPEIAISIVAQLVGHRNKGPAAFPPQARSAAAEGSDIWLAPAEASPGAAASPRGSCDVC